MTTTLSAFQILSICNRTAALVAAFSFDFRAWKPTVVLSHATVGKEELLDGVFNLRLSVAEFARRPKTFGGVNGNQVPTAWLVPNEKTFLVVRALHPQRCASTLPTGSRAIESKARISDFVISEMNLYAVFI